MGLTYLLLPKICYFFFQLDTIYDLDLISDDALKEHGVPQEKVESLRDAISSKNCFAY